MTRDWQRASRGNRCPICDSDSWCFTSRDGSTVGCMRADGAIWNGITPERKTAKDGVEFWLFQDRPEQQEMAEPRMGTSTRPGPPEVLDETYRGLIQILQADTARLRNRLERRHLPAATIDHLIAQGYAILDRGRPSIAKRMVDAGHERGMACTPGFYIDDRFGRNVWSIGGTTGILCPARNTDGLIVGCQIRKIDDASDFPRYTWLSSSRQGGSSPGSPIHVPQFRGDGKTVRVTEGVLKAEVATHLSGMLTVGVPGTGWRDLMQILPRIKPTTVLVAFDADFRTNPHIARAAREICDGVRSLGMNPMVETWPEKSKGVDDALLSGVDRKTQAPDQILSHADERPTNVVSLREEVIETLLAIEDAPDLLSTGLPDLDARIGGGIDRSELVIIAARPSHGKSALGAHIMFSVAAQGMPCMFVSAEMSPSMVNRRTIARITRHNREQWRHNKEQIIREAGQFFDQRADIHVAYSLRSVQEIFAECERAKQQFGIGCLLVDYAQLLQAPGRGRYEQVTAASKALKAIATDLGMVVLLLAQVGRATDDKRNSESRYIPTNADLKESGQLEQDADVIILGVRPIMHDPEHRPVSDYLLKVGKVRDREPDLTPFVVTFDPSRMDFHARRIAHAVDRHEHFDQWNEREEF